MNKSNYKTYFKALTVLLLLNFFMTGCDDVHPDPISLKNAKDLDKTAKRIKIDKLNPENIVDSTAYIRLETNENCLIGKISKIRFFKNFIVIMDAEKANSVFVFDISGKFLTKIGRIGKGPEEFQALRDIFIDQQQSTIGVLDPLRRCVLSYKFDGKFVGKTLDFSNVPFMPSEIEKLKSSNYITYSSSYDTFDDYSIHVIQPDGHVINKFLLHPISYKNLIYKTFSNPITINGKTGDCEILSYLSSKIYKYSDQSNSLAVDWIINSEKAELSPKELKEKDGEAKENPVFTLRDISNIGKNTGVNSYIQNDDQLYYNFFDEGLLYRRCFYLKQQNILINFSSFNNPLSLSPPRNNIIASYNGFFVSTLPTDELKAIKANQKNALRRKNTSDFKRLMTKLNQPQQLDLQYFDVIEHTNLNDNPLLILTKLKKTYVQ